MTEMIERVARRLRAHFTGEPDDGSPIAGDGDHDIGLYTDIARAAIEAMREPTLAQIKAGCDDCETNANRTEVERSWRAMIDAALAT